MGKLLKSAAGCALASAVCALGFLFWHKKPLKWIVLRAHILFFTAALAFLLAKEKGCGQNAKSC